MTEPLILTWKCWYFKRLCFRYYVL